MCEDIKDTQKQTKIRINLIRMAIGYWHSQVLFAAHSLDIFNHLSSGPASSDELAKRCGASVNSLERLLNACTAIGLLKKKNSSYNNSFLSEQFLLKGKPNYMGHWVSLMADWYAPWRNLLEAVKSGKPVEPAEKHLGRDKNYTRNFILGMHDYAMGVGRELVDNLPLEGRRKLLDLGGGPGTYSILLSRKNPDLKCVVFDLPPILEITKELIEHYNLSDRVLTQPGDYSKDQFGEDFDVVILSNVLHQENPDTCQSIIQKSYDALVSGGLIVIHGMFLNASKDGPMWPTFHSLLLLLIHGSVGRAYTVDETFNILRKVGFVDVRFHCLSLLNAGSLIVARRE